MWDDPSFARLVEQIAQERGAGRAVEPGLRLAAEYLRAQPDGVDPRRDALLAQIEALLARRPLVEAVAGAEGEDAGMAALLALLGSLQETEAGNERRQRLAELLAGSARGAVAPDGAAEARPADWLWGVPTADPGTQEFGPALSPAEIDAWERGAGVRLPGVLRQAYLQQNGGMTRNQRFFLYRLEELEPAGAELFEGVGAEAPEEFDPDLTFQCGYDDEAETTLFLAYRSAVDPAPVFYGYWMDGGSLAWVSEPAQALREPGSLQ